MEHVLYSEKFKREFVDKEDHLYEVMPNVKIWQQIYSKFILHKTWYKKHVTNFGKFIIYHS